MVGLLKWREVPVRTHAPDSAERQHLRDRRVLVALEEGLADIKGVQNRGFGLEVSDLWAGLDADERVEMGNTCLGGE